MEKCGCGNEENPKIIYADTLKGNNGWTPVFVDEIYTVGDTVKIARKLIEYIGGNGLKPTNFIGQYLSQNGYTTNRNLAINYKGPIGETGPPGSSNPNLQSLQQVTDVGNVTSNAISITGFGNFSGSNGLNILGNVSGSFSVINHVNNNITAGVLELYNNGNIKLANSIGNSALQLFSQTELISGAQFNTRVSGSDALGNGDFVTLGQVNALIPSTPTLQQVTDNGNTTDNVIYITGANNLIPSQDGLMLGADIGSGYSELSYRDGSAGHSAVQLTTEYAQIAYANLSSLRLESESGSTAGAYFSVRVRGKDAINDEEFVTLQQLNAASSSYTFENGLREDGGVVKLGTSDYINGLIIEPTEFVYGNNMNGLSRIGIGDYTVFTSITRGGLGVIVSVVDDGEYNRINIQKSRLEGEQSLIFNGSDENEIFISDTINNKGLEYTHDYSTNGTQDDRWIPDWGAVKNYADNAQKKPSKTISSATYTFVSGDEKQWLIFTNSGGCTVTIPDSVFSDGDGLQGVQRGAGQIEFTAGSGVTLNKSSLSNAKTAVENSVFGLRFESASTCTLFGELELI